MRKAPPFMGYEEQKAPLFEIIIFLFFFLKEKERKRSKKPKRFYRFLLSSGESPSESGCTNRLSLTGSQKPFATDAADAQVQTRSVCKDRLAELLV